MTQPRHEDDDRTVTKAELFQFLEIQFAFADKTHDGVLDVEELRSFLNALADPAASLKHIRAV